MNRADAIMWARDASTYPKMFFDDASTGEWFVAVGARAKFQSEEKPLDEIEAELQRFVVGRRAFGGMAFDTSRPPSVEWKPFGAAYFFEPVTLFHGIETEATMHAAQIGAAASGQPDDDWRRLFSNAQNDLRSGALQKVVLARRTEIARQKTDPWLNLHRSSNAITFCIQPDADHTFWGNTPERLFQRRGASVSCDALAGTRGRGVTAVEDAALRDELLTSEKDRMEHDIVVRYLASALGDLSDDVVVGETTVRSLDTLQHLFTPVSATIKTDRAKILSAIHPTPALCGEPREQAMAWLARNEPFHRGWYGGTVGWLTPDEACMAVAIRSALQSDDHTFVYAGAGIVETSECEAEWDEICNKGATIEQTLGANR